MKSTSEINLQIENNLTEVKNLIEFNIGHNPYIELEKSLKIVHQKNYSQYGALISKIGDTIRRIYDTRIDNNELIIKKLDDSYKLAKQIVNSNFSDQE